MNIADENREKAEERKPFILRIENEGTGTSLRYALERLFAEASMLRSSMIPFFSGTSLRGFDISLESGICIDSAGRIREFEYEMLSLPVRRELMKQFVAEMATSRWRRPERVKEITFHEYGKTHAVIGNGYIALAGVREYIPVKGLGAFWGKKEYRPCEFKLIHDSEDDGFIVRVECTVDRSKSPIPQERRTGSVIGLYIDPRKGLYTSEGDLLRATVKSMQKGKDGLIDPEACREELGKLEEMKEAIRERLSSYGTLLIIDNDLEIPDTFMNFSVEMRSVLNEVRNDILADRRTVKMSPHLKAGLFCPYCGKFERSRQSGWGSTCTSCGRKEPWGEKSSKNLVWFYEHGIGLGRSPVFEIEEKVEKVFAPRSRSMIS